MDLNKSTTKPAQPVPDLPPLLSIAEIHRRLQELFPPGVAARDILVREMAARVVYVFLYGGMIEGSANRLRPSHVYFFTAEQAGKRSEDTRRRWLGDSVRPGFRPTGKRWYADTTREPIRDETIRHGLVDIGAAGKIPGVPVTSSKPIYFLKQDFAALFDPSLTGAALTAAIRAWQSRHLTAAARARMAVLAAGRVRATGQLTVACPDGTTAPLSAGPSSVIAKAVVEVFAAAFLPNPALLWLSESSNKVRHSDQSLAKSFGLKIDQARVLPDIILANIGAGGEDTSLIFVEVVATDGPMTQARQDALLQYVRQATFPEDQCYFVTAFEDRAAAAFKKCLPQLAWGSFAWFRSEPEKLVWLVDEPFDITG